MECPKCGSANKEGAVVCSACFAQLDAKAAGADGQAARPVSHTEKPATEERPREVPKRAPARVASSGGRRFPIAIPLVVVVAVLVAAWWFILANPSPVPAAKRSMEALASTLSTGDVKPFKEVVSSGSQQSADQLGAIAGMLKSANLKLTVGEVKGTTIQGSQATVKLDITISAMGRTQTVTAPLRMVKEGSIIRRQWKLDLGTGNPAEFLGRRGP